MNASIACSGADLNPDDEPDTEFLGPCCCSAMRTQRIVICDGKSAKPLRCGLFNQANWRICAIALEGVCV